MLTISEPIETITEVSIQEHNVNRINSIAKKYKPLRQASKTPTFALTYNGTWSTLVRNSGFSVEEAKHIEQQYHTLYKESDDWVKAKIKEAETTGYVTGAFGLKLRTHKIKQSILDSKVTPREVSAEERTAANFLGQSWCLLNTYAGIKFNNLVRTSKYKHSILPISQIHDAQYFIIKDNVDTLLWLNEHLTEIVKWNNHKDIYHDKVGLGGETFINYPDWSYEISIPNDCNSQKLCEILSQV